MSEVWYRYEEQVYAPPLNEFDRSIGDRTIKLHLRELVVDKHTPKGVWLRYKIGGWVSDERRFVRKDANKRFACPTKEEALESFIARKTRQMKILEAQYRTARIARSLAAKELE